MHHFRWQSLGAKSFRANQLLAMAAMTRARSGALFAARSAIRSASRQWHSSGGLEARGAAGSPRTRTGAAPNTAFQFSAPVRPNSQLVSGGRMRMPRIACVESLLPLHSALAAARLVSRLSTSSLAEQVFLDVRHCEHRRTMSSGGSAAASPEGEKENISVTFVTKDGDEQTVQVPVGMSMLEAAHENDVELEGACEGSLACSTCHVIFMDEEFYNKLPEPSDEENDMLDLAFGLTETSRLGCQVIAKPELNGMRLALPAATRNFAVDGHVAKPH